MKRPFICLFAVLLTGALLSQAAAHYLWVTIDGKTGDHGITNVYFEGGPGAGDGQYLDPFIERGTTWIRTADAPKAKPLEMEVVKKPGKRWLSSALPADGPRSVDSYGKWGVYRYGETDVLLHYHARNLEVSSAAELEKLARAEQLKLDIVPRSDGDDIEFTLLWEGKPAVGRSISVRGPEKFSASLKTDKEGKARITPKAVGTYRLHAVFEQKEEGTDDGKAYQLIRHHGTMLVKLPLK